MSTFLVNRVQSAYPRSIRRSTTNIQSSNIKQRPTTSKDLHASHTDVFKLPPWRKLEPSAPSITINNRRRPKTASISTTTSTQFSGGKLRSDEIEGLLQHVDNDETFIVQVDCLANYRKLVQTIDLRQTPFDRKSLCILQQRENRIVQKNACHDIRFRSLLDILEPSHKIQIEQHKPNNIS